MCWLTPLPERSDRSAEWSSSSPNGTSTTAARAGARHQPGRHREQRARARRGRAPGRRAARRRPPRRAARGSSSRDGRRTTAAPTTQREQGRPTPGSRAAHQPLGRPQQPGQQRPDRVVRVGDVRDHPQVEPVDDAGHQARRRSACRARAPAGTCRTWPPTGSAARSTPASRWSGITQAGRLKGEKTADWASAEQRPPAGDPGIPERRARQLALDLLAQRLERARGVLEVARSPAGRGRRGARAAHGCREPPDVRAREHPARHQSRAHHRRREQPARSSAATRSGGGAITTPARRARRRRPRPRRRAPRARAG